MWDLFRYVLGEATMTEVALSGVFFGVILLFTWAPLLGEAVGAMFEGDDDAAA